MYTNKATPLYFIQPHLLVQRCNGTTAGQGYLEVNVICKCKSPHLRTVNPHWVKWLDSSTDFNPNHNHVNAAPKQVSLQTTSRPQHHPTPKQNYYI